MQRHHRGGLFLRVALCVSLASTFAVCAACVRGFDDDALTDREEVENRLMESVRYLASDRLQGRGVGTRGLDLAADYIAEQFAEIGLKTDLYDGTAFQTFYLRGGLRPAPTSTLALVGPDGTRIELKLGEDFTPLSLTGVGSFDLPLVFAGYGITAPDLGYDDFDGIDASGKALVLLRREPQQNDPQSGFNGTRMSQHAPFVRKVANAIAQGAAAAVFCTDAHAVDARARQRDAWQATVDELVDAHSEFRALPHPTSQQLQRHVQRIRGLAQRIERVGGRMPLDDDPLLGFSVAGALDERRIPVLHCRRRVVDRVLGAALTTDLATLERQIDQGPTPHSAALDGWRLTGQIALTRRGPALKNVLGALEGTGPQAEETIVVGAHYDHLGYGGAGSLSLTRAIHNGADDNASGTAVLVEVARQLAARREPLPRRIVFIAFTAEEMGLVGSKRYASNPLVPMNKTVAMVNLDMVGRLTNERLSVYGTGTAQRFGSIIDRLNKDYGFRITKLASGYGPSDHASFHARGVPVLHFFTGLHGDYHQPGDDYDKLNVAGMRRIAEMVTELVVELATAEQPLTGRTPNRAASP